MSDSRQHEITKRLQIKLLERFEVLLDSGEMSSTDAATLARLLSQNGWNLDPAALPEGLRDKIKRDIRLDQEADADELGWASA